MCPWKEENLRQGHLEEVEKHCMHHLGPNVRPHIFSSLSSSFETMAHEAIIPMLAHHTEEQQSPRPSINCCRTVFKETKAVMIQDSKESDQAPQANAGKEKQMNQRQWEKQAGLFRQRQAGPWSSSWCVRTASPSDGGQHPAGGPGKIIRVPPPKNPEEWGPRWHPQGAPGLVPRFPQMGHLLLYPRAARNITIPLLVYRRLQVTTVLTTRTENSTREKWDQRNVSCRTALSTKTRKGSSPFPPSPLTPTISHTRWEAGSFYGMHQR